MRHRLQIVSVMLAALFLGALTSHGFAQQRKIELSPFVGYQWATNTNSVGGYLNTKNTVNYGGAIDFNVQQDLQLELLYIYCSTQTRLQSQSIYYPSSGYADIGVHYMQVGYVKSFPKGKVEPFGAFTLGAVMFSPGTFQLDNGSKVSPGDTWRFAVSFGGGAKIFFGDHLGIRLQARLMMPIYFSGAGMYVGTGGSGFGVSGGIPVLMGDFTAGLILAP